MRSRQEFEALALPHLDAAHTLARWLMRDPVDAEDVVQEAFLRAYRAFDSFSGPDIKPWLLRIVRNTAYRSLSGRRAANVISIDEAYGFDDDGLPGEGNIPLDEPNAEDRLLAEADGGLAIAALATLQPIHREVLVLREIEQLSYRQIAGITGIPMGTVMSRLARARADLRGAFHSLARKEAR